jgi:hypothetical protein
MAYAINGRFSTRQVDMRGWNFTNVNNLGTRGRLDVVPGTRVADRLGSEISVSSRPIVLPARGSNTSGNTREALRDYVREAPRVIERTSNPRDSQRLAPFLARQKDLPDATVQALRERTVVAQRGRLTGPGASEMAPRTGGGVVERGRVTQSEVRRPESLDRSPGSSSERGRIVDRTERPSRSGDLAAPQNPQTRPDASGRLAEQRPERSDSWRGQPQTRSSQTRPQLERETRPGDTTSQRNPQARVERPGSEWRGRPAPASPERGSTNRTDPIDRGSRETWRARPDLPPAQRVIEGSVPRRRSPGADPRDSDVMQHRGYDRSRPIDPRDGGRSYAPSAPRDAAPRDASPRQYAAPRNDAPDRGRSYSPPSRSAPRESAPRSYDRAPAPRSAPQAAPPRSAPAPRSAPPPSGGGHRGRS